jgi:CubicO group peptidase (beta-lactamase class C family)
VPTGSITDEATSQLDAMGTQNRWINSRELLGAGVPSVSGAGTARGLADAYAAALGLAGRTAVLTPDTVAAVTQLQTAGTDLVLGGESRYAVLFQKPTPARDFGTAAAFGHDGAGGALAFADPVTRVAFGYVTGRAPVPAGADRRALALAAEVRRIRLGVHPGWR